MLNPKEHRCYHNLGQCYLEKGDYASAIKSFSLATKLNPEYVDAFIKRAIARSLAKAHHVAKVEYDEIRADCKRALELDPKNSTARGVLELMEEHAAKKAQAAAEKTEE